MAGPGHDYGFGFENSGGHIVESGFLKRRRGLGSSSSMGTTLGAKL